MFYLLLKLLIHTSLLDKAENLIIDRLSRIENAVYFLI
jgi:hypothetical protein